MMESPPCCKERVGCPATVPQNLLSNAAMIALVDFLRMNITSCKHCAHSRIDIRVLQSIDKEINDQLRNRTKSKIIGFSRSARWVSMEIKLRAIFSILFQLLRISKAQKAKFEKIDLFENFVYLHM